MSVGRGRLCGAASDREIRQGGVDVPHSAGVSADDSNSDEVDEIDAREP